MNNNMTRPPEDTQRLSPGEIKKVLGRMLAYISGSKRYIAGMLFLLIASTVLNLFIPDLIGKAVDVLVIPEGASTINWNHLITLILTLLAVFVFSSLFSYFQGRIAAKLARETIVTIRKDVSGKLARLPVGFFDAHKSGDILSRLTNDIDSISNLISQAVGAVISSLIVIVGCVAIMLVKSVSLTLVCLSTVVLNIIFTLILSRKLLGYFRTQQKTVGTMNSHVEQSVSSKKTIHGYNMVDDCVEANDRLSDELTEVSIKSQVLGGIMSPLMCIIGNINFLLIVAAGALMYMHGGFNITIGTIQSFTLYSRQFTKPINELSGIFSQFMTALASAERVFEIIDAEPEEDYGTRQLEKAGPCSITFENVCFSYVYGVPVLKDFSLHIEKGQTVAIVGHTGVGKTTLISLLMRFYEPDSGRILIDGVDIRQIPKTQLRRTVTTVLQNTAIFEGSVKDNIAYGNFSATDEDIIQSAKLTSADAFIEKLDNGYDTQLSHTTSNLSQGQQQLLCLARAALTQPRALILDEAMSSVDSATELDIQSALLQMMANQTCIIIAHRLSTVKNADLIAVCENGSVIESGTHDALISKHNAYYNLYKNNYLIG